MSKRKTKRIVLPKGSPAKVVGIRRGSWSLTLKAKRKVKSSEA